MDTDNDFHIISSSCLYFVYIGRSRRRGGDDDEDDTMSTSSGEHMESMNTTNTTNNNNAGDVLSQEEQEEEVMNKLVEKLAEKRYNYIIYNVIVLSAHFLFDIFS